MKTFKNMLIMDSVKKAETEKVKERKVLEKLKLNKPIGDINSVKQKVDLNFNPKLFTFSWIK